MTGTETLLKILPLLAAVAMGYILYRTGFLKDGFLEGFKKIVVNVTLPAAVLAAFASIEFKTKYILVFIAVFFSCMLIFLIGIGIGKLFKIKSPYFPYLLAGFEAGMVGYALYNGIYGSLSEFGIIDVGQVLFVFLVTVPMISNMGKDDVSGFFSKSFKTAVRTPIIWAIITGLALSISGIWRFSEIAVYSTVKDILGFISAPTPFLISLVIGSGLKFSFAKMKTESLTAILKIALSMGFAVLISTIILKPLGLSDYLRIPLFSMFVLPGPFIIPVFMDSRNRAEVEYVSNTLSIGTLLGLIGFIIIPIL